MDWLGYLEEFEMFEEDHYVIHRGPGNHVADGCWCYPLVIPLTELEDMSDEELQELLNQHTNLH